jgi:hypothetical protein
LAGVGEDAIVTISLSGFSLQASSRYLQDYQLFIVPDACCGARALMKISCQDHYSLLVAVQMVLPSST